MIYERVDARSLTLSDTELSARMKTPKDALPPDLDLYIEEIRNTASPAFSAQELDLTEISDSELEIGGVIFRSGALARVMRGCSRAVLLCATLGIESERLLRKYSALSPSAHFMIDAAADAMVEALCDRAEERIFATAEHTARFSPGYADLSIEFVRDIVKMTDAGRRLGVSLTESFLAVPTKTVTAIIGKKEKNGNGNT